jgi:glycosyltransferase involved in cell wall biosynthesis
MGGIEKELIQLAAEFLRRGHSVSVVTTTCRFPDGVNSEADVYHFQQKEIAVGRLTGYFRSTLRGFQPSGAPIFVPGLRRTIEGTQPDAALFFNIGWPLTIRATVSFLSKRIPVLLRTYYHPPGGRLHRWKNKLLLETAGLFHGLVCATVLEKEQICREGGAGIDGGKLAVIPPGVNLYAVGRAEVDRFRAALQLGSRRIIAHTARPSRFKGTDLLIRALPSIHAAAGKDVALLVLGTSDEIPALSELARANGVGQSVVFAGDIADDRQVHVALAAADLFALPSRYESLGIAFLEAMAEGLPVIGVPTGGVPEVIRHGENGFLLSEPDACDELSRYAAALLQDSAKREAMGKRGRERVEKDYLWSRTADNVLALLGERMVERDARRPGE